MNLDRRVVAVIGAECSGKSTLAAALAETLPATLIPEQLRRFVDEHGRAPARSEQASLMRRQIELTEQVRVGWVVSDGAAMLTAVYSIVYFDDPGLLAPALDYHRRRCALTVWCGIEIGWQPDPGQRDGPEYRQRADEAIGRIVREHGVPVLRVHGAPEERTAAVRRELRRIRGTGS